MALETHAESIGTSLVDLVRDLGLHPGRAPTLHTHTTAVTSRHFSSQQHMSLVRAAGGSAADIAVVSGNGAAPGSPASGASGDAPSVFVDRPVAGHAEAAWAADTLVRLLLCVLGVLDVQYGRASPTHLTPSMESAAQRQPASVGQCWAPSRIVASAVTQITPENTNCSMRSGAAAQHCCGGSWPCPLHNCASVNPTCAQCMLVPPGSRSI